MRLGVVLDVPSGEAPLAALVGQATALEQGGLEVAWLEEGARTGPPLITVAALAPLTRVLRVLTSVPPDDHPLAIAEAAVVADNCSNGRLTLVLAADNEQAEAVRLSLRARPFHHAGTRWTIPANLPENDGAAERIVVTPPSAQLELPVSTGLVPLDLAGDFDPDELVERLRASGDDLAVLRLPESLSLDERLAAIARVASFVRPRVIQFPLPDGLEAHWSSELAEQIGRMPTS